MNSFSAPRLFRHARRFLLLAGLLAAGGIQAADTQPGRFLLLFETSPALKKNLPAVRETLDNLFSSNLQNEIQENDDLAVWVVDQELHTGTYPLASWSPANAALYSQRLGEYLRRQNFTRHAKLDAVQPLLNRVVKNSERLTILIVCDGQSRLVGTPYDAGVNEIITNAAARSKSAQAPFILVLRAYRGEYLGCSVNRSLPLNFPKFPPPPKPEPPPVAASAANPPPPAPAPAPVPALIIVGTNTSTNITEIPAVVKPPSPAVKAPEPKPSTSAPPPKVVVPAPPKPMPATNLPPPEPVSLMTSAPPVTTAVPVVATNPPVAPVVAANPPAARGTNAVATSSELASPNSGWQQPLLIGVGALVVAGGLGGWLAVRARRPRGSLITSSMNDDVRPPRK